MTLDWRGMKEEAMSEAEARARFRAELDREERLRAELHDVVCDGDHSAQTAPEHWRCVIATRVVRESQP